MTDTNGIGLPPWGWPGRTSGAAPALAGDGTPGVVARVAAARGLDARALESLSPVPLADAVGAAGAPHGTAAFTATLERALAAGPVGLLADYDVDGGTSAAILADAIELVGGRSVLVVPDRLREGFGPNPRCLDALHAAGCRSVVTLDCGSAVLGMLDAHAERTGAVVLVLDHHTAEGGGARWAGRIVNPQATPAGEPHRGLCTGALAWFLARALAERRGVRVAGPHEARWSALAGLALVCDVMPMGPGQTLGRALVAESFAAGHAAGPAVEALLGLAGRAGCALDWWDWAFRVGPRLNAGSRMGESALAARALRSRDPHDVADAAQALHAHNEARKAAGRTLDEAASRFALVQGRAPVLVAALDEATPGLAGIAASRLVERFGWPAVVLGRHPAGGWSGSGRSALGFDLGGAVAAGVAAGAIAGGGGHAAACGLRIAERGVEEARRWLAERFEAQRGDVRPVRRVEAVLGAADVEPAALARIDAAFKRWEPWGPDWRAPVLGVAAHVVRSYTHRNGHVFMTLDAGGRRVEAIWWRAPPRWKAALHHGRLRAIVRIDTDARPGYADRPHRLVVDAAQWPEG